MEPRTIYSGLQRRTHTFNYTYFIVIQFHVRDMIYLWKYIDLIIKTNQLYIVEYMLASRDGSVYERGASVRTLTAAPLP